MNLQQINESGPSIAAFFTTAIVALCATLMCWYGLETIHAFKKWWQEGKRNPAPQTFSLGERLAMVTLILRYHENHWPDLKRRYIRPILINS